VGKPKIELLSEQELDAVHQTSLHILEQVGVYLPLKEALDILRDAGASVDYDAKIARIPPHVVETSIRKAPSEFKLYSRNSKCDLNVGPGNTYYVAGGGSTRLVDIDTAEYRDATIADLARMVRLVDGLDNISVNNELVLPRDVPPAVSSQHTWATMFRNTSKNCEIYVGDIDGVRDAIRLASAIVGSEDELVKKPIIHFLSCVGQPLTYEKAFLEGFIEAARRRIPIVMQSGAAAGATGPATLAGTFALVNAEILSEIILSQVISPGLPIVYGNWARTFDMKSQVICFAGPEYVLMRIAAGQLVKRYKIPLAMGGFQADSKMLDIQGGYEKYVALISVLADSNLIIGSGMLDAASILDPLNFVLDDELAASYSRVMKGMEINSDTLALNVVKAVGSGPGRNFLAQEHTLRNIRKEEWLGYRIFERRPWELWKRDGAKDTRQRARERTTEIIKTHQPDVLPQDVDKELNRILKEIETRALKSTTRPIAARDGV